MKVDISVIIPTIGRDKVLISTLSDLLKQKNASFEVIIVNQNDNSSTEVSKLIGTHHNGRIIIRQFMLEEKSAAIARNMGALAAASELLLFLDDDVQLDNDKFIFNHMCNYNMTDIAGVAGQILSQEKVIRQSRHPWSKNEHFGWLYFPLNYDTRVILNGVGGSGNLSIRKEIYLSVGGMDEQFEKGAFREESDFIQRCMNAGYSIVFDPRCSLIHLGEPTGGIRSWGEYEGIRQIHHVVGEWYFIFRHANFSNWIHYLTSLLRRQIFIRTNLKHPGRVFIAIARSVKGSILALRKLREGNKTLLNPLVRQKHIKRLSA